MFHGHGRDGGRGGRGRFSTNGRFPVGGGYHGNGGGVNGRGERGRGRTGSTRGRGRGGGYHNHRDGWSDYVVDNDTGQGGGHQRQREEGPGPHGYGRGGGRGQHKEQWSDRAKVVDRGDSSRYYHDDRQLPAASDDIWICKECKNENLKRDGLLCVRCGKLQSRDGCGPNSSNVEQRRRSQENDYYGPAGSSVPGGKDDKYDRGGGTQLPKKEVEWPPLFEQNGGAFMFDSRCGMFYEPISCFYYDPKTKLYFSNKKQSYFRHVVTNGSSPPVFEPVVHAPSTTTEHVQKSDSANDKGKDVTAKDQEVPVPASDVAPRDEVSDATPTAAETKPKIAISIGAGLVSKKLSSFNDNGKSSTQENNNDGSDEATNGPKKVVPVVKIVPMMKKTVAKNIAKWNQKAGATIDVGVDSNNNKVKSVTQSTNTTDVLPTISTEKEIKRTADGKPICLVCKRKFASLEKLNEHERVSALHKQNVAKLKKQSQKALVVTEETTTPTSEKASQQPPPPAPQYRDRAQERRQIFGETPETQQKTSSPSAKSKQSSTSDKSTAAGTTTSQAPHEMLTAESTNIGSKMLQKLGWKSEDGLGRGNEKQKVTTDHLKRDWERIEGIAASNSNGKSRKRQKATVAGSGIGSV